MDIVSNNNPDGSFKKHEVEQVQKKKHEYKIIDKFIRTKGMKLYAYSPDGSVKEIEIREKSLLELRVDSKGDLVPVENDFGDTEINTNDIHFESVNYKNALRRVERWKLGKIDQLDNLRKYNPDAMKLF